VGMPPGCWPHRDSEDAGDVSPPLMLHHAGRIMRGNAGGVSAASCVGMKAAYRRRQCCITPAGTPAISQVWGCRW